MRLGWPVGVIALFGQCSLGACCDPNVYSDISGMLCTPLTEQCRPFGDGLTCVLITALGIWQWIGLHLGGGRC